MNKKKQNKPNNSKETTDKIDKSTGVNRIAFGTAQNTVKTTSKKVLLKDLIKGKSYEELMKLLPMMVTVENTWGEEVHRKSFDIIGFGPESVILAATGSYEYEPDIGDWGNTVYYIYCNTVPFCVIDEDYIQANKPTEKQQNWLNEHGYAHQTISGYEAWHIIHDAVEKTKRHAKQLRCEREQNYDRSWDWDDYDPCYEFDIPNQ